MNTFQWIVYSFCCGVLDSLKGCYYIYLIDCRQQKAHAERSKFLELRDGGSSRLYSTGNKSHRHPAHVNKEEPRLLFRVFQCCCLNGLIFGCSMLGFNHFLLPVFQSFLAWLFGPGSRTWYWVSLFLSVTFNSLWVLPIYILSRIVNGLWFQDIGNVAYRYSVGRPKGLPSLSNFLADTLFSLLIQVLFMIQSMVSSWIPLAGLSDLLFFGHMCLLYSLYSFEYKWVQMGWPLSTRLAFIETNWPYFLGFGFPLTLITYLQINIFYSGALFSFLFPIFIVAGNEAAPITNNIGCMRLPAFSLVVSISNRIVVRQSNRKPKQLPQNSRNPTPQQQPQQQQQQRRQKESSIISNNYVPNTRSRTTQQQLLHSNVQRWMKANAAD